MNSRQQQNLSSFNHNYRGTENLGLKKYITQSNQDNNASFSKEASRRSKEPHGTEKACFSPSKGKDYVPVSKDKKNFEQGFYLPKRIYMKCMTWSRDTHGLFDYESNFITKKQIYASGAGKLIRMENDVEFLPSRAVGTDLSQESKPLIQISENKGKSYSLIVQEGSLWKMTLYLRMERQTLTKKVKIICLQYYPALRTALTKMYHPKLMKLQEYKVRKGDIVKLGRIKFKVIDMRTENTPAYLDGGRQNSPSPMKHHLKSFQVNKHSKNESHCASVCSEEISEEFIEIDCAVVDESGNENNCKVCWSNEQSAENPLLNSCKCDGSVRFIHYECLKHWLKTKMQKKEEANVISYSWKLFECEICKAPYPYLFKMNGVKYRLVDVDVPQHRSFLWLESLTFKKNSSRMVHLIMPDADKNQFKFGRGHDSDVRVSDISVSRCHAFLRYNNDHNFYLEDNFSKFGTLVLQQHSVELIPEEHKVIQIGRSVITFSLRQTYTKQLKTPSPIVKHNKSNAKLESYLNCDLSSEKEEEEKPIQDYYVNLEEILQQNQGEVGIQQQQHQEQMYTQTNQKLQMFEQMISDLELKLAERESQKQQIARNQQQHPLVRSPQFMRNRTIENQQELDLEERAALLGKHREKSFERGKSFLNEGVQQEYEMQRQQHEWKYKQMLSGMNQSEQKCCRSSQVSQHHPHSRFPCPSHHDNEEEEKSIRHYSQERLWHGFVQDEMEDFQLRMKKGPFDQQRDYSPVKQQQLGESFGEAAKGNLSEYLQRKAERMQQMVGAEERMKLRSAVVNQKENKDEREDSYINIYYQNPFGLPKSSLQSGSGFGNNIQINSMDQKAGDLSCKTTFYNQQPSLNHFPSSSDLHQHKSKERKSTIVADPAKESSHNSTRKNQSSPFKCRQRPTQPHLDSRSHHHQSSSINAKFSCVSPDRHAPSRRKEDNRSGMDRYGLYGKESRQATQVQHHKQNKFQPQQSYTGTKQYKESRKAVAGQGAMSPKKYSNNNFSLSPEKLQSRAGNFRKEAAALKSNERQRNTLFK